MIKKEKILANLPDKVYESWTTSLKFKEDLIEFLGESFLDSKVLELGTFKGHTTRVLSFLFKEVWTVDNEQDRISDAKKLNIDRKNINYINADLYRNGINGFSNLNIPDDIQLVFIDAVHEHLEVGYDTLNSLKRFKDVYIVYDDYGAHEPVNNAVNQFLKANILEFVSSIGHSSGSTMMTNKNKLIQMESPEGIICKSTPQTEYKILGLIDKINLEVKYGN